MNSEQMRELIRAELPTATEAERQMVQLIAYTETGYAAWVGPGEGSHNQGAIQGKGPAGSFETEDTHEDGKKYLARFKRYHTDAEAIRDLGATLLKPNVRAALASGDLSGAVAAMRRNGYFELRLDLYQERARANYQRLTNRLGWEPLLRPGIPRWLWGVAIAAAGWHWLTRD